MNNIDPKIKYEFESSANTHNNSLSYLDVRVIITEGIIITDVYSKPTDTYNYLPFNRAHPRHVVRNIPYSLAGRIKGIVSDENLLEVRMRDIHYSLLGAHGILHGQNWRYNKNPI